MPLMVFSYHIYFLRYGSIGKHRFGTTETVQESKIKLFERSIFLRHLDTYKTEFKTLICIILFSVM